MLAISLKCDDLLYLSLNLIIPLDILSLLFLNDYYSSCTFWESKNLYIMKVLVLVHIWYLILLSMQLVCVVEKVKSLWFYLFLWKHLVTWHAYYFICRCSHIAFDTSSFSILLAQVLRWLWMPSQCYNP